MSDPKKEKKEIKLPENVMVDYTFERMLKSFNNQVDRDGILQEVRARRYYIKPSEVKRLAKKSKRRNK
jgi:ribosomal protein S21